MFNNYYYLYQLDLDQLKNHVQIFAYIQFMQSIYSLRFISNNIIQNFEAYTLGVFSEGEQTFNFQIAPLSCLFKIIW